MRLGRTSAGRLSIHSSSAASNMVVPRCSSVSTAQGVAALLRHQQLTQHAGAAATVSAVHKRSFYGLASRRRSKVVTVEDAVSVVNSGDTVVVGGFVASGAPEALLKALGQRYLETGGQPHALTLLFGGGPGDWANRGLNHLAKTVEDIEEYNIKKGKDRGSLHEELLDKQEVDYNSPNRLATFEKFSSEETHKSHVRDMVLRTVGAHYGQVPRLAELALDNRVAAWALPMGSVSRMIRAAATHDIGHITHIGKGTFVDPQAAGGCINDLARKSTFQPVEEVTIKGDRRLLYHAMPVQVAFVRGTTADPEGNISMEHESLLGDQRIIAMAARNSGGTVVAQVKRLAEFGSIPTRQVAIPGALVDCVVVVSEEDHDTLHGMSYMKSHDPALTMEIKTPMEGMAPLELDERKVIARRAAMLLKANQIVNLGIGMPEGVAKVAGEERILDSLTLTTEAGALGGMPAMGHQFGPAYNATSIQEMNQQFDFYDGGGLDICFLGAAQITARGDVNVSRLEVDRLTGPGGFIDITQSTRTVVFMCPFTAKGLDLGFNDGSLVIKKEGAVKKFVNKTLEVTFSGDEAVRRGQTVYYLTERAVFRRSAGCSTLILEEVAPGVDLERDVLGQMEFAPVLSENLKVMDSRIFQDRRMGLYSDMFDRTMEARCAFHKRDNTMFVDMEGLTIATAEDIEYAAGGLEKILKPLVAAGGPINMIINYSNCDVRSEVETTYRQRVEQMEQKYYKTVRRFASKAFRRAKLMKGISMDRFDPSAMFKQFDADGNGVISLEELRKGMFNHFALKMTEAQLSKFSGTGIVNEDQFSKALSVLLGTSDVSMEDPDAATKSDSGH